METEIQLIAIQEVPCDDDGTALIFKNDDGTFFPVDSIRPYLGRKPKPGFILVAAEKVAREDTKVSFFRAATRSQIEKSLGPSYVRFEYGIETPGA